MPFKNSEQFFNTETFISACSIRSCGAAHATELFVVHSCNNFQSLAVIAFLVLSLWRKSYHQVLVETSIFFGICSPFALFCGAIHATNCTSYLSITTHWTSIMLWINSPCEIIIHPIFNPLLRHNALQHHAQTHLDKTQVVFSSFLHCNVCATHMYISHLSIPILRGGNPNLSNSLTQFQFAEPTGPNR